MSVSVQIAESPQARQTGLMGRRHLEPDAGMVFLFDQPTAAPFWMKDTPIPLSIAFWGRDRRIVAMIDTAPCRADPCPLYDPHATYVGAVEVNAGFFSSHRIEVGDDVALSR